MGLTRVPRIGAGRHMQDVSLGFQIGKSLNTPAPAAIEQSCVLCIDIQAEQRLLARKCGIIDFWGVSSLEQAPFTVPPFVSCSLFFFPLPSSSFLPYPWDNKSLPRYIFI